MSASFQGISFNCKGLIDPSRAVAFKKCQIHDSHNHLDFLCLQELKCSGKPLEFNLKKANNNMVWYSPAHQVGKRGVATGINFKFISFIEDVQKEDCYVAVTLGAPFLFTLINVYAPCHALSRATVWDKINLIQGPIILLGDFNMVESLRDRWKGLDQYLQGRELHACWNSVIVDKNLVDMSANSGFSWANNKKDDCFRATRLDKIYFSKGLLSNSFPNFHCFLDKGFTLSDHWPLFFNASQICQDCKLGWFHADISLLKFKEVKEEIVDAFTQSFNEIPSPSQAWIKAVYSTQNVFRNFMKKARDIRKKRREGIVQSISKLEALSPPDSPPSEELSKLKHSLKMEDLLEAERALIFTRDSRLEKLIPLILICLISLKRRKLEIMFPFLKMRMALMSRLMLKICYLFISFMKVLFPSLPSEERTASGQELKLH